MNFSYKSCHSCIIGTCWAFAFNPGETNLHKEYLSDKPKGREGRKGAMVMPKSYIPSKGDIVWLELSPQAGYFYNG